MLGGIFQARLERKLLRERKSPSHAEGLRGDFKSRWRLLPLVFTPVHLEGDGADEFNWQKTLLGNLGGVLQIFHVGLENPVQVLVRWKRILVGLVRAKFGGWML